MATTDTQQTAQFAAQAAVSAAEAKQYLLSIQQPVIDISESVADAQNAAAAAEMARDQAQGISTSLVQTIESQLSEQEAQFESQMTTQQSSFESSQSERESSFEEKSNEFESRFSSQLSAQESTFSESQTDKENRFQQFLNTSGYVFLGDYQDGPFQFSARNQYIRYDNEYYRLNAATDVGFTTTGTDATSFASDVTHFVLMDGDTLRQNLGSGEAGLGLGIVNTVYGEMADRILKRIYGFNVCAHGARSIGEDGYEDFDSLEAIQKAIDVAHAAWLATGSVQNVFFPSGSTFLVSSVPAVMESGVTSGLWCLRIRSGVRLAGGGTIKLVANAFAADTTLFRMIGSDSGGSTRPTDVHFEGITIDGNLENQVANSNAHGIWVYTLGNSSIKKCKFHDIAGCGGSLRGMIETPAKNIEVTGNLATNCGNIGLQVSWFDGLIVTANIVRDCTDNGIDIYGNSGESGEPTGINFSVNGNFVYNCLTGVFLETVANGSVTGNTLQGNAQNIHLNRINSQPRNITIDSNAIDGGLYGIRVQGDMRGISIIANTIRGYSIAAFRFGNATTVNSSTSYINARNNTITPTVANSYVVWIGGGTASRITVKNNTVENTIGLTAEYLYHNQATTNVQVTVGAWKFWGGSLSDTGVESYSEGTFSPTVAGGTTGGTGTYTNQYGKYTKIGNIVHFTLSVAWSAHTGAGAILINGLPFAASADNNQTINAAISSVSASTTSARLFMRNINGSTVAQMIFFDGAAATSYPQINSAGGSVQVSGFYFAS
ncbi:right-handed parallel beta-helix repeat-containing protein [Klebsiella quasipneumoniae]|uniref:right-handed parallel beta-helix repeat-containing protein n=1 Tax=Klebsiella quasipneumoniae TaxID=1463165 RepID=UPI002AB8515C|nr:right-handed parallel beta-helix repeat-containing protein [Klebsiella quasipneumoniae]MDZ0790902.1 right-handed parallel beta-helix repeat-containing protein [Klebsiella quasipneumoniae]